jgi:hypothetical protein
MLTTVESWQQAHKKSLYCFFNVLISLNFFYSNKLWGGSFKYMSWDLNFMFEFDLTPGKSRTLKTFLQFQWE